VRGRHIALGYWRNEKQTRETFLPDGWLRTGDLFKADEWGNLLYVTVTHSVHLFSDRGNSFVDRSKDILKVRTVAVRLVIPLTPYRRFPGCRSHHPRSRTRCWRSRTS
jgi:acyl-CoA synthetase (AMP-forming)/AMP-acid ligase II